MQTEEATEIREVPRRKVPWGFDASASLPGVSAEESERVSTLLQGIINW